MIFLGVYLMIGLCLSIAYIVDNPSGENWASVILIFTPLWLPFLIIALFVEMKK